MKLSIYIPIALAAGTLFITACNREELASAKQVNDSLISVIHERESTVDECISSFNEVEGNLDAIASKQQMILTHTGKSNGEIKLNQKERINAEIEAINNLMEDNRKTIAELTTKLKKSSRKNLQLEKTIATLNRQFFQKNLELTTLNDELNLLNLQVANLKTTVDTLTMENYAQAQTITEKTTALHTAYYIIGKSKELQEAKLIDKKGGLLGIGRTAQLNADVDNSKFFRIDYTQTGNIPINSTHAKIITSHPSDSYAFNTDANDKDLITSLEITNPEKFWSASKYLVIVNN